MTARTSRGWASQGFLVHGVNVKPGKPTILAVCDDKPVFGLPGNPVNAMVIFDLFVLIFTTVAGRTTGRQDAGSARLAPTSLALLARGLRAGAARRAGEQWAVPVFGKGN